MKFRLVPVLLLVAGASSAAALPECLPECRGEDLAGASLYGEDLTAADLRGANLTAAVLTGAT